MKLHLGVGVALFVVGLALAAVGLAQHGKPWGFRGHAAVLAEATHNVELVPSSGRAEREHLDDALLPKTAGAFLDVGDSVRVGVHSEARLVRPGGSVVLGDGTRATLTEKGLRLDQGTLDVTVAAGGAALVVELTAPATTLTLRAADVDGAFRVLTDGKAEARVLVRAGSIDAASGAGATTVTAGKVLAVGTDGTPQVGDPPSSLGVSAACADRRVTVQAPPATQLFVDGALYFPEGGQLTVATVPEHPERAHVLGRDVAGNVAPVTEVVCTVAPPPPAPLRAPLAPPRAPTPAPKTP
ncbi:MAG: hypothetical protein HYS27_18315 [Deltaproteobacteria bacterium]|nr:hypothetical protein [Deltaproteobacteria bacterium]